MISGPVSDATSARVSERAELEGRVVSEGRDSVRVLYSFPHRIGAGRICETAWQEVAGAAAAGTNMLVVAGSVARPLPEAVTFETSLARGRVRAPYRLLGNLRAIHLHDYLVARRLREVYRDVDVVHAWPSGARATLRAAARLGIPTMLERPNAHTRYAYEVVRRESERLGVPLPRGHEHAYDAAVLQREEEEFKLADYLLCPSDFVRRTFLDEGYPSEKLLRHSYGFDEGRFHADLSTERPSRPFSMLFVGLAAVRKGLHFALEAWLRSEAHSDGVFRIAGSFLRPTRPGSHRCSPTRASRFSDIGQTSPISCGAATSLCYRAWRRARRSSRSRRSVADVFRSFRTCARGHVNTTRTRSSIPLGIRSCLQPRSLVCGLISECLHACAQGRSRAPLSSPGAPRA